MPASGQLSARGRPVDPPWKHTENLKVHATMTEDIPGDYLLKKKRAVICLCFEVGFKD